MTSIDQDTARQGTVDRSGDQYVVRFERRLFQHHARSRARPEGRGRSRALEPAIVARRLAHPLGYLADALDGKAVDWENWSVEDEWRELYDRYGGERR